MVYSSKSIRLYSELILYFKIDDLTKFKILTNSIYTNYKIVG